MELTKKIVFTIDNQVCVAHMGASAVSYEEESKSMVPDGVQYQLLDDTTENFPTSRILRNAWIDSTTSLDAN